MDIVQIAGIVFAAVVILALGYLYRESAIAEGKTEVAIGPVKFSLSGKAQKAAQQQAKPEKPAPPKIEQSATDLGRIEASGPEIEGGAGEIKQTASGGGTISGSAPKIS